MPFTKGQIPWNKKIRTVIACRYCSTKFSDRGRTNRQFCNSSCSNKYHIRLGKNHPGWTGGPLVKNCTSCGKVFITSSQYRAKKHCSFDCYWKELRKGIPADTLRKMLSCRKPNNEEIKLYEILEKHFPGEWKFVGDGQVWIEGKNPDFINVNGHKQIVELFGEHWHEPSEVKPRKEIFARYGYKTLIVWDTELKNREEIVDRVKNLATERV